MGAERIEESYGTTPLQQGMLFHTLSAPGTGADVLQIVCELAEEIHTGILVRAWSGVMKRHGALRTAFRWHGLEEPLQEVWADAGLPVREEDWSGVEPEERNTRFEDLLREDRREGFDLTRAPLMRVRVVRFARADFRVVWTVHHAVVDGRALALVLDEVFASCEALACGREPSLAEAPSFRGYVEWLLSRDFSSSEGFWRERLRGATLPTPLPQLRPPGPRGEGRVRSLRVGETTAAAIHAVAREHGLALSTLLHAAWALVLSRHSGEESVVFASVLTSRASPVEGAESMVGLLIDTVPFRVRVREDATLLDWLAEIRQEQLAVREHQHVPLTRIQEWSALPPGLPVCGSGLMYEHRTLTSAVRRAGERWSGRSFRLVQHPSFPINLLAWGEPDLPLELAYDASRLGDDSAERLLIHFRTALEQIAANPGARVEELDVVPDAERELLLRGLNDTERGFPRELCLHQLFERQAAAGPGAGAAICGTRRLDYGTLDACANRLAQRLRGLGVGPEVPVGVCMDRKLDLVVALLAVLKAGGAYVPLDPAYPRERITSILDDAAAPVLLTQEAHLPLLADYRGEVLRLDTDRSWTEGEPAPSPAAGVRPENAAYVIYTSGSTGKPKGVRIEHRSAVAFLHWARDTFPAGEGTGVLASTSVCFDLSVFEIFFPLSIGAKLVLAESALHLPHLPARDEVTILNTVPSAAAELVRAGGIPHSVRVVNLAGEPLKGVLAAALYALPGVERVYNLYGPTESTTYATCALVPRGTGAEPTIGAPVANTRAYLLDDRLRPVPFGAVGEVYLSGAGLARDYPGRPDLTAERYLPDPFAAVPGTRMYRVGDLARWLPDGELFFLGRRDHQVKVRGFRIELGEVEAALLRHPGVRDAVVAAGRDAEGAPYLVGYVVGAPAGAPLPSALRAHLRAALPEYMVPAVWIFLDALPLTPNGKVDRRALPDPGKRSGPERAFVAPRTPTEDVLAKIWRDVLRLERVGVTESFFELGGHSLLGMRVATRLREVFQVEVPVHVLFDCPTVERLGEQVARSCGSDALAEEIARTFLEFESLSDESIEAMLSAR